MLVVDVDLGEALADYGEGAEDFGVGYHRR